MKYRWSKILSLIVALSLGLSFLGYSKPYCGTVPTGCKTCPITHQTGCCDKCQKKSAFDLSFGECGNFSSTNPAVLERNAGLGAWVKSVEFLTPQVFDRFLAKEISFPWPTPNYAAIFSHTDSILATVLRT